MVFNSHLRQCFDRIPGLAEDMEPERAMFRVTIVEAAVSSCGFKGAGASHSGNPQDHWLTPEVRRAIKLKKESYRAWMACGTPSSAYCYWQTRWCAALAVAEVKTRMWEKFSEAMKAVKQLRSGSALGVDEIRPDLLKVLDFVGLSWLTRLCNIAWTSRTVPLEWQTRVVVPIFKKGDQKVCSNYRGITPLSLPGKVYTRVLERRV